jgi:hypothetical protein
LLYCAASSLTWRHISTFFPQLTKVALLIGEIINPNSIFLSRIGYHFEAVIMHGIHFTSMDLSKKYKAWRENRT